MVWFLDPVTRLVAAGPVKFNAGRVCGVERKDSHLVVPAHAQECPGNGLK
jgi:hypothetical protein